jgi:hypothetical protein
MITPLKAATTLTVAPVATPVMAVATSDITPITTPTVATAGADDDIDAQIAALQTKKREKALRSIGGDFDKVKAQIAQDYAALVKKADELKEAVKGTNRKYYAPWEIQAKRPDWPIRDYILAKGKTQTVTEIAEGVDYETDIASVQAVIDKDQKNTSKKLFVQVGHAWWVTGKPMPKS